MQSLSLVLKLNIGHICPAGCNMRRQGGYEPRKHKHNDECGVVYFSGISGKHVEAYVSLYARALVCAVSEQIHRKSETRR